MLATLFFLASLLCLALLLTIAGVKSDFLKLFVVISVVFVNAGFFFNHVTTDGLDGGPSDVGLAVTTVGLVCVVAGFQLGRQIFRHGLSEHPSSSPRSMASEQVPGQVLFWTSLVILVPTWAYFVALGFVPLFDAASAIASRGVEGLGVLNQSRLSRDGYLTAGAQRIPLQGLLEIYRNVGVPVLFALSLTQIRRGHPAFPRVLLMVLCVISVMAAGQRWPLMNLLVAAIFVLSSEGRGLTSKPVRVLIGSAVVGGIALSALQSRTLERFDSFGSSIQFGIENLIWRVTTGQVEVPIASYYSEDPSLRWRLGYTYLQNLSSYLPGSGTSYPVEFYQTVTGDPTAYTSPPDLYTEAYLNFSWVGVVVLSALWGVLLAAIDLRVFRFNSSWNVALRSGLLTVMVFSSMTGLSFTLSFIFVAIGCVLAREAALFTLSDQKAPGGLGARTSAVHSSVKRPLFELRGAKVQETDHQDPCADLIVRMHSAR